MENLIQNISIKTNIDENSIKKALLLLENGFSVPFIARYRKDRTNNLDEEQLFLIQKEHQYVKKLLERKKKVKESISKKGVLSSTLNEQINKAKTLSEVEDIYLPYKEKRKTRATVAIKNGLEPLANKILENPFINLEKEVQKFINENVKTKDEAINGAKDIIAEKFSENMEIRNKLREKLKKEGMIKSKLKKNEKDKLEKFRMYYDSKELIKFIPSHRVLAIFRGEKLKILSVKLQINERQFLNKEGKGFFKNESKIVKEAIEDGFKRLLFPSIEREIIKELKEKAEEQSINLFAKNLEQLLLVPPLKGKNILGVDPAFVSGCKMASIDKMGGFISKDLFFLNTRGEEKVLDMIKKNNIELIAIGNGTASRETQEFITKVIKKNNLSINYIVVNEAGASVYSASKIAIKEFLNLSVEERSAISIARRVLDPLSELIKIDPRSIGVGQYQYDVNQKELKESLDFITTKVVNKVGVNVNSASQTLLSYVSGLDNKSAQNLVEHRAKKGSFKQREEIKKVKGIGKKTYKEAIGFLKIYNTNPLDKTFIHPDDYVEVEKIIKTLNFDKNSIGKEDLSKSIENKDFDYFLKGFNIEKYTLKDILEQLKNPLFDIRENYETPLLRNDILKIEDLKEGMKLQGVVRSVVDFGAFVDIGLKEDGLVHISKFSKQKINHPLEIVSVNDIIDVYVEEIDIGRKRVSLTLLK